MKKIKNKIIIILLIFLFIFSIKLEAVTIVLDPGHGGSDPGTINSRAGIIESDVNYKIATYLTEYLEEYENVKIILTRKENEYKTLQQRADVGFDNNADLLLSLHINSAESGTVNGCERICYI